MTTGSPAGISRTLETDYLVVGCGAGGMAFTDSLVAASDPEVVMVDRRPAPGGHWNEAYPFVRLHMPSAFYGVNSLSLGNDRIDGDGLNQGLYERAGGPEICAYYDRAMQEQLLRSGQVRYFPLCDYVGDHRFVSRASGDRYEVKARKGVVDANYLEPSVPASSGAPFEVAPEARCVPVGELPQITEHAEGYVIVGAGKTSMDACLWLLELGVPPGDIRWIKPREPWLINRAFFQGGEMVGTTYEGISLIMEAAARASDAEDFFARLATDEWLLAADENVAPTMYKGALATVAELEQLRRIEDVVRLGRVRRIERDAIVLDDGETATSTGALHVHCAASGLNQASGVPIFGEDRIILQAIRSGFIPFNSAFAGFVEATREDPAEKNRPCPPNPLPDVPLDFVRGLLVEMKAGKRWSTEPDIQEWLEGARLNWLRGLQAHSDEPRVQEAHRRMAESAQPGLANLEQLLAEPAANSPALRATLG